MKYFLLAIFVLFAAQPLPAVSCDMHDAPDTQSQHSNMHDGPMDHDAKQAMDCCDDDPEDAGKGCGSMFHCGACPVGLAAIQPWVPDTVFDANTQHFLPMSKGILNRTASPPFRPPIA